VHIDHTPPELSILGVRGRWDTDGLNVYNSTDLSTMRLVLTPLDTHSGLHTLRWTLGTDPNGSDIGQGALSVQRMAANVVSLVCISVKTLVVSTSVVFVPPRSYDSV
jgi:hypothetical protein